MNETKEVLRETIHNKTNLYGQTYSQLEQYLLQIGEKASKAPFIFRGLYQTPCASLLDLPQLRASLKAQLAKDFSLELPRLVQRTSSADTEKFLFALQDESLIEAVLMRQRYGNSLCISSQVGCNMACAFCQSGRFKKVRNLQPEELTGQLLSVQQHLQLTISNVVLMGIGEPFDNYDNVMQFLEILQHPYGLALGKRHVTVSTCGLAPRILQYSQHRQHGLLAISLHAPDDETRSALMPVNRRYPVAQLFDAARAYIRQTGKKVMLEYVMLQEINDHLWQAQLLAERIGTDLFHVNLIPYNETQNFGFSQSSRNRIIAFYDILKKNHVTVTMRREFGSAVNAACGQLRADYEHHRNG